VTNILMARSDRYRYHKCSSIGDLQSQNSYGMRLYMTSLNIYHSLERHHISQCHVRKYQL